MDPVDSGRHDAVLGADLLLVRQQIRLSRRDHSRLDPGLAVPPGECVRAERLDADLHDRLRHRVRPRPHLLAGDRQRDDILREVSIGGDRDRRLRLRIRNIHLRPFPRVLDEYVRLEDNADVPGRHRAPLHYIRCSLPAAGAAHARE